MRKIKNFRVNLRVKEVLRLARELINAAELFEEIEQSVQRYCRFYCKFVVPSMVYETFPKGMLPFSCGKGTPSKWVAGSIFFVTIGNGVCDEYEKNKKTFDEYGGKFVSAIAVNALEESEKFARKLILSEAQEENCVLSEKVVIQKDLYEMAAQNIPINKIGMSIEAGKLNPRYSSCGLFYWTPLKKNKK